MSILLTADEQSKISIALSYICLKLQGRLKNITLNGNIGVLVYGKHTDRLMINLVSDELTENWFNEKTLLEVRYMSFLFITI